MHIVCPNCAASYQVSLSSLGAAGRSVRCVRCRSIWFQSPAPEPPPAVTEPEAASDATIVAFRAELGAEPNPPAASAPAVETAAASPAVETAAPSAREAATESGEPSESSLDQAIGGPEADAAVLADPQEEPAPTLDDIAIPGDDAPQAAAETPVPETAGDTRPANIETIASRRRGPRTARRKRGPARSVRIPAAILALACVVAAMIVWRHHVVRHAPQMASLYAALGIPVNLRGLAFTEVAVSRDTHDGVSVLVVEGTITSTASRPVEVPRLRFAMRNDKGAEVYAWTAIPAREVLGPGETLPFRSRLASPPSEGRDVTVRFFNRLDATAVLR